MTRTVYLNGAWLPEGEASISVFDRGFLFADAVYEAVAVLDGKLIDYPGHAARLRRSLAALDMALPLDDEGLLAMHRGIVARNHVVEGLVYLQVSRGSADRDFILPRDTPPTVVSFTQTKAIRANALAERGLRTVTMPDGRWARRDIKTVQLLYASLAKTEAHARGADDVLLVEDGFITEASSANVGLVTRDGCVVTRDLSPAILPGITRASVLDLARGLGQDVAERPFTVAEARAAAEVFITSATSFVLPVVRIDDGAIGDGRPGPVARRLREAYTADRLAGAL